jgi:DNA polymerase-3 subunit alpha
LLNTPNTEKIKSIIGAHRLIFIDEAQRIKGIGLTLKIIIDQDGFYFDAVYFTNVVHLYPINEMGIYAWYGKITNRFGFCSMNVLKSKKISIAGDPKH